MHRNKSFLVFLILLLISGAFFCFSQSSSDDCESPDSPAGPPPDNADDNFSYNLKGALINTFLSTRTQCPDIGIFSTGNVFAMDILFGKTGSKCIFVKSDFNPISALEQVKALIISTGGLMGDGKSANIKLLLEQYVARGGTIVVFAQQSSIEYELLPKPTGESLRAYGWRNDQSCYSGSTFFDSKHPILSSCVGDGLETFATDGYFDEFPSGSIQVMKRTKNRKPLLLYYNYGLGTVILTSLYSDWALVHGQSSTSE